MIPGSRTRPAFAIYHSFWQAVDWLFPPECGGCGRQLTRWCDDCQAQIRPPQGRLCEACGVPVRSARLCPRCRSNRPAYDALRSLGAYTGPLRNAIHRLKYQRDLGLAEPMAQNLLACLQTLGWQTDLITNVPLGKSRLKERGYNQVTVIARPLAMAMNLPLATQAIVRERETRSQVGLSAQERLTNVAGAFRALPNIVSGKSVLLVDDVATTGATLNACAAALRTAGAVRVYALTLARALRIEDHSAEVNPSTQTGV